MKAIKRKDFSPRAQQVVEKARRSCIHKEGDEVTVFDLLAGIVCVTESPVHQVLMRLIPQNTLMGMLISGELLSIGQTYPRNFSAACMRVFSEAQRLSDEASSVFIETGHLLSAIISITDVLEEVTGKTRERLREEVLELQQESLKVKREVAAA